MFNLACCESFCIENFAYNNHIYSRPFPTLCKIMWILTVSPSLERCYVLTWQQNAIWLVNTCKSWQSLLPIICTNADMRTLKYIYNSGHFDQRYGQLDEDFVPKERHAWRVTGCRPAYTGKSYHNSILTKYIELYSLL